VPNLTIHEVPTGTECFDWKVPNEWNVKDAYIIDPNGCKIANFKENNLHLVSYSTPVNQIMSLKELQGHLHSLSDMPGAISYVTSYYELRWGFCLSHNQRMKLIEGDYKVVIDSTLEPGHLTYGEILIPGKSADEVFLSTYICHPSMANNELSGPVVATYLAKWIESVPNREKSYRIVFIPETIGSILYISKNLKKLKGSTIAGFNLTCIGDDRTWSFVPSRGGNTLADKLSIHVLNNLTNGSFDKYSRVKRGSDLRQYCSPGVDFPMVSLMRSKYGTYPEYHTSFDNLDLVTKEGLFDGYMAHRICLEILEKNDFYKVTNYCEPFLGKRGLYPTLGVRKHDVETSYLKNVIAFCDGKHDLVDIAELLGIPVWKIFNSIDRLYENGLIKKITD
jgi:aminopeptidase-like protein